MTFRSILPAIVLAVSTALLCTATAAQDALPTLTGERGRVVILDASGSMRNTDYSNPQRSRMEAGREILEATFTTYEDMRDATQTGLIVFGADPGLKWDDVAGQYGNTPRNYPNTGALCNDSRVRLDYRRTDRAARSDAERVAQATQWGGMTLTHTAILQALESFDPRVGGEIILISDMTETNCLPDGADDICEAIAPALLNISTAGGAVSAIVFGVPESVGRETLSKCIPTREEDCPATLSPREIEDCVNDALRAFPLSTVLLAGGSNNLDPTGVNLSGGTMEIQEQTGGKIIANGALGPFSLSAGTYTVDWVLDGWSETRTINISAPVTETLTVDPSILRLQTVAANGGAGPSSFNLTIRRLGGATLLSNRPYTVGTSLELANGDYEVSAVDPTGATAAQTVTLKLGSMQDATLTFAAGGMVAPSTRDVAINVTFARPTLDIGRPFAPLVTLSGGGTTPRTLSSSGFSGALAPGNYAIDIASANPHRLPLRVDPGSDRLTVDLVVTPGIFEATSSGGSATFELRDATGRVLFTFIGQEVRHSIVDGQYELSVTEDGASSSERFNISAGDRLTFDF